MGRDILAGVERPPLFSWEELSTWRWGGADEAPGIDNPGRRPSLETLAAARARDIDGKPIPPGSDPAWSGEAGWRG